MDDSIAIEITRQLKLLVEAIDGLNNTIDLIGDDINDIRDVVKKERIANNLKDIAWNTKGL